jgi:hypothetical protein
MAAIGSYHQLQDIGKGASGGGWNKGLLWAFHSSSQIAGRRLQTAAVQGNVTDKETPTLQQDFLIIKQNRTDRKLRERPQISKKRRYSRYGTVSGSQIKFVSWPL